MLAEGRQIFYGPAALARRYFEDMGFECQPGANVSDFLTSVTVNTERRVWAGFERKVPTSVEEFELRYKGSDIYKKMEEDMKDSPCLLSDRESTTAPPSEKETESIPAKNGAIKSLNRSVLIFLCQVWICCKRYLLLPRCLEYKRLIPGQTSTDRIRRLEVQPPPSLRLHRHRPRDRQPLL